MEPTIGRIVHYAPYSETAPHAALVTEVEPDGTVALAIFSTTSTYFLRGVKQGSEPGQWDWPPRA